MESVAEEARNDITNIGISSNGGPEVPPESTRISENLMGAAGRLRPKNGSHSLSSKSSLLSKEAEKEPIVSDEESAAQP